MRVKVADFGLAKANRATVTRGVGTPVYMPPEMFDAADEPEKTSMLAVDVYVSHAAREKVPSTHALVAVALLLL